MECYTKLANATNNIMSTTCTKEQCDPTKERRQIYKLARSKSYFCRECFIEENALRIKLHPAIGLRDFEDYPLPKISTELKLDEEFCPKSPDGKHKDNSTMFVNTCKYCGESEFFM